MRKHIYTEWKVNLTISHTIHPAQMICCEAKCLPKKKIKYQELKRIINVRYRVDT